MKKILNKIKGLFKKSDNKLPKCNFCKKVKSSLKNINLKKWFKENKLFSIGIIAVFIAFIFGFVLKSLFVAATINGKPVSRLRVIRELEKNNGLTTLDSIVTEELIRQEAKKKGVKISKEDVDSEIASIEESLKDQGQSLDEILVSQGTTRKELVKNIELQKMIEEMLSDKLSVTDEEVQKYMDENASSFPEGTNMDDVKTLVKQQLSQQKLSTEFQGWFESIQKDAKINILVKY
ncbi:MAG: SurA N-terminal domain-containing protein [Patescibacteria group bacterium]